MLTAAAAVASPHLMGAPYLMRARVAPAAQKIETKMEKFKARRGAAAAAVPSLNPRWARARAYGHAGL